MRNIIKEYELNKDIDVSILKENGFFRRKIDNKRTNIFRYIVELPEDIEIRVDIDIENKDFDVQVFDTYNGILYNAFYNEDKDFSFVNLVIDDYNKELDLLVEKGILKEKKLEETKPKTLGLKNKE